MLWRGRGRGREGEGERERENEGKNTYFFLLFFRFSFFNLSLLLLSSPYTHKFTNSDSSKIRCVCAMCASAPLSASVASNGEKARGGWTTLV